PKCVWCKAKASETCCAPSIRFSQDFPTWPLFRWPPSLLAAGGRPSSICGVKKLAPPADKIRSTDMNADETEVYDFLKGYPGVFVSVTEISRRMGARRKFDQDRTWARPILRRMELDGTLESNDLGEYRIKKKANETTSFKKA